MLANNQNQYTACKSNGIIYLFSDGTGPGGSTQQGEQGRNVHCIVHLVCDTITIKDVT